MIQMAVADAAHTPRTSAPKPQPIVKARPLTPSALAAAQRQAIRAREASVARIMRRFAR